MGWGWFMDGMGLDIRGINMGISMVNGD